MTVKELREKLSQFDDETRIVVYGEKETEQAFLEIDDVSIHTGTPTRLASGKAAFRLGKDGPASWLFISVSAA